MLHHFLRYGSLLWTQLVLELRQVSTRCTPPTCGVGLSSPPGAARPPCPRKPVASGETRLGAGAVSACDSVLQLPRGAAHNVPMHISENPPSFNFPEFEMGGKGSLCSPSQDMPVLTDPRPTAGWTRRPSPAGLAPIRTASLGRRLPVFRTPVRPRPRKGREGTSQGNREARAAPGVPLLGSARGKSPCPARESARATPTCVLCRLLRQLLRRGLAPCQSWS
jgi:hypothetical protein